ncbi:putative ErfK/YbiS/YcfS/YnhG family protein precursor [Legionella busanensis]|uniref:Putative ErfK/YbiS/YcfS/YnhG family protein n=1 Tax=Legionella busanensis TaxID=190655 RepID=A0A378JLX3_9GAMM|nr:L,D-transpeptidase family protein [Legionella busanensis]STX51741.1 putative ErfK/YbiS/YcfS/YnhG family protein precursor [Legionella busanensis]
MTKRAAAMILIKYLICLLFLIITSTNYASTWVFSERSDLIGKVQYATVQAGETLSDVGIRYDIGYHEMVQANPKLDPLRPLYPQTQVIIPSQYILPPGPHQGLVINLAEFRLYYYVPGDNIVITMPVGIGREGWKTPIGVTKIIAKERDPHWRPTANVRAEAARHGTPIPQEFPPGEGNPLGRHVLRLGWPTYLIHGTNRRDIVGSRVSAGCIRMMPEDIESLFDYVKVGTSVRVINEPVKLGYANGAIFLEAHPLLVEQQGTNLSKLVASLLATKNNIRDKNNKVIQTEIHFPSGIPVKIG